MKKIAIIQFLLLYFAVYVSSCPARDEPDKKTSFMDTTEHFTLEVSLQADDKIEVKLFQDEKLIFENIAVREYDEFEIDENNEGEAYPSVEYIYSTDNCLIAFRLEAHQWSNIKVISKCERYLARPFTLEHRWIRIE